MAGSGEGSFAGLNVAVSSHGVGGRQGADGEKQSSLVSLPMRALIPFWGPYLMEIVAQLPRVLLPPCHFIWTNGQHAVSFLQSLWVIDFSIAIFLRVFCWNLAHRPSPQSRGST